jgi:uncharacterized protein
MAKKDSSTRFAGWATPSEIFKRAIIFGVIIGAVTLLVSSCWPLRLRGDSTDAIASRLPGQVLPITARAMIAKQPFDLEVAHKKQQQSIGLMYRTFLPPNRGMLFPFQPAQPVSFWMKNCRIALDMIFLRESKVVAIAANVPPCVAEPCPTYGPTALVDQVIEVQGKRTAALGLQVGDTIDIQWIKKPLSHGLK